MGCGRLFFGIRWSLVALWFLSLGCFSFALAWPSLQVCAKMEGFAMQRTNCVWWFYPMFWLFQISSEWQRGVQNAILFGDEMAWRDWKRVSRAKLKVALEKSENRTDTHKFQGGFSGMAIEVEWVACVTFPCFEAPGES
ncbi:unnamed protein product [Linum trigynum]|uniref:Uncharacterized protein n=1 Tax=Linum trigynum TaxID=586398 RepID=A0AAV2GAH5_9ROSI